METYRLPARISRGHCTIFVDAESKEEALAKAKRGEWSDTGDEDWECELEDGLTIDDVEET